MFNLIVIFREFRQRLSLAWADIFYNFQAGTKADRKTKHEDNNKNLIFVRLLKS
jgi:hypothetical protein